MPLCDRKFQREMVKMFGKTRKKRFAGVKIGIYKKKKKDGSRFGGIRELKIGHLDPYGDEKYTAKSFAGGDFRLLFEGATVFYVPKEAIAYVKVEENG